MTGTLLAPLSAVVYSHAGWEHGGDWWWVWRLGMLLFWIVVLCLVFWGFRRYGWRREPNPGERVQGILAERFARGEISVEEYRERLSQLQQ